MHIENNIYVPEENESITMFIRNLVNMRDQLVRPVVGIYEDITLMVRFGDTYEDVMDDYNKQVDMRLKRNAEHYVDQPAYEAIKKADRDAEHEKVRRLMGCLRRVCEFAGYSIVGRVELLDESTGKIWK